MASPEVNEEAFKPPVSAPLSRPTAAKLNTDIEVKEKKEEEEKDEELNMEVDCVKNEGRIPLPAGIAYSVPAWSGLCRSEAFSLEVLKNGVIIDTLDLCSRPFHVLGRLPACHITMEHPSLSRFHAVLQFNANEKLSERPAGWYLYDLDSTHGTWVNKVKVRPMEFHRVRVGHVLKFGGSSRLYVVQVRKR